MIFHKNTGIKGCFLSHLTAGRRPADRPALSLWKYLVYCCRGSRNRLWRADGGAPPFPEAWRFPGGCGRARATKAWLSNRASMTASGGRNSLGGQYMPPYCRYFLKIWSKSGPRPFARRALATWALVMTVSGFPAHKSSAVRWMPWASKRFSISWLRWSL